MESTIISIVYSSLVGALIICGTYDLTGKKAASVFLGLGAAMAVRIVTKMLGYIEKIERGEK